MDRTNKLGLDTDDLQNVDMVLEALTDILARMNVEEYSEEHFAELNDATNYANFIVGGIIYKNALDLCAGHDHDDDDDEDDE